MKTSVKVLLGCLAAVAISGATFGVTKAMLTNSTETNTASSTKSSETDQSETEGSKDTSSFREKNKLFDVDPYYYGMYQDEEGNLISTVVGTDYNTIKDAGQEYDMEFTDAPIMRIQFMPRTGFVTDPLVAIDASLNYNTDMNEAFVNSVGDDYKVYPLYGFGAYLDENNEWQPIPEVVPLPTIAEKYKEFGGSAEQAQKELDAQNKTFKELQDKMVKASLNYKEVPGDTAQEQTHFIYNFNAELEEKTKTLDKNEDAAEASKIMDEIILANADKMVTPYITYRKDDVKIEVSEAGYNKLPEDARLKDGDKYYCILSDKATNALNKASREGYELDKLVKNAGENIKVDHLIYADSTGENIVIDGIKYNKDKIVLDIKTDYLNTDDEGTNLFENLDTKYNVSVRY